MSAAGEVTEGTLLAGRVRYAQPADGYRTGIEPVLLAAAVPAGPASRVLEAGCGAGAGLLCLAARVPGCRVTGLEIDPAQAGLAARNLADNGWEGRGTILTADVSAAAASGLFDHACANPPWHSRDGTASPVPGRVRAKSRGDETIAVWAAALARVLRPRGTLTLILPASLLSVATGAMTAAGCGALALCPLWPRAGEAARLMLVQAVREGRGPDRILPGLVLHAESGGYTEATQTILRDGAPLLLARQSRRLVG